VRIYVVEIYLYLYSVFLCTVFATTCNTSVTPNARVLGTHIAGDLVHSRHFRCAVDNDIHHCRVCSAGNNVTMADEYCLPFIYVYISIYHHHHHHNHQHHFRLKSIISL